MTKQKSMMVGTTLALVVALTVGCRQDAGPPPGAAPPAQDNHGHDHAHHEHPTTGPHGGELIELGSDDYHAELVHDEQGGTVTIYILDAHAEQSVPIDATVVTINLIRDGQAAQFTLAATPEAGNPSGKSSRFVSNDAALGDGLEQESAEPQLVVMINDKQYRGRIDHAHHDH